MIHWRKSSRSADTGAEDCVELARLTPAVGVRDSKHPEAGHLELDQTTFAALLTRIRSGIYDR